MILRIFKQKFQFRPIIRIQMNLEYRDTDSTNFRKIKKKFQRFECPNIGKNELMRNLLVTSALISCTYHGYKMFNNTTT